MPSTWPELHAGTNFNYVWDVGTLAWVKETQPGGGGGGGGAVTIADGADVAEGSTGDAAWSGVGAGTVVSILKKMATSGTGGGPATIADGADVAEGATTDAAVTTDVAGTVSGKLRGLVKWAFERMPASLGQKAMAASLPVVLASDQSGVPVTGPLTDAQLRASAVPVSAASLPLPTGAATEATLALVKAKTDNLDVLLSTRTKPADQQHVIIDSSASIAITGPLTDAQLRATPVPVSGTVTSNQGGAPWSENLTQVGGAAISLGAKTSALSIPVVLATDEATLPISAASLPLPAGAATEATLATRLADTTFTSRINTQGQKTMAASTPVVIASDQAAIPITGSISATSAATASALPPLNTEAVSSALSQDLRGNLRVAIPMEQVDRHDQQLEAILAELRLMRLILTSVSNQGNDFSDMTTFGMDITH